MRVRRVLIREGAWLMAAVVMALVTAGEIVHRAVHEEWLPWSHSRNSRPRLHEFFDSAGQRWIALSYTTELVTRYAMQPTVRNGLPAQYSEELFTAKEPPAALKRALESRLDFEHFEQIGWPTRFAACFTTGNAPSVMTEPEDSNTIAVTSGVWSLGMIRVATRPVFPGFLLLVAANEAILVVVRAGVGMPAVFRRPRRERRGLCVGCGFDLDGLSGGVCPECGEE